MNDQSSDVQIDENAGVDEANSFSTPPTSPTFQVNSVVEVAAPEKRPSRLRLLRFNGKVYGVESDTLGEKLGDSAEENILINSVENTDAQAEFIAAYGEFNMIEYRGKFYGAPHGLPVDWNKVESGIYPTLLVKDTYSDLRQEIISIMAGRGVQLDVSTRSTRPRQGVNVASGAADLTAGGAQRLIRSLGDYDIYQYEGIYYGIPSSYGTLRLDELDPDELVGVIRDVSVDVIENEIRVLAEARGET